MSSQWNVVPVGRLLDVAGRFQSSQWNDKTAFSEEAKRKFTP